MKKMDKYGMPKRSLSLFGSHCCGIFICLIICFTFAGLMTNLTGQIVTQCFVLLVYCFPIYSTMWNLGHTDLNRANFGHIKTDRSLGFKIGAIACIPMAILSLLFIISKFGFFYNFVVPYRLINAQVWPTLNIIQLSRFLPDFNWWQVALFAILPLIMIPISGFSYILGNHDFAPMQKLIYKNSKKKK